MKLAILTGGGDVPGLNVVLRSLTEGAAHRGWQVLGIKRGWFGLVQVACDDAESVRRHTQVLTPKEVYGIDQLGGTMLHSSRTLPSNVAPTDLPDHLQTSVAFSAPPHAAAGRGHRAGATSGLDLTAQVLQNLHSLQIDVLVAIGGDDTLRYAERLAREGFQVLGIPKTMDNDVPGTSYCLGFATCVSRTVAYLHQLRSTAASHERIAVVEVMGRNSGASALVPAYLAHAERCVVAEVPCAPQVLGELLAHDRSTSPHNYAMVVVSEGARLQGEALLERGEPDPYGHRKLGGIGQQLGDALAARGTAKILVQQLGYLVRSGPPDALDCMVALQYAALALRCVEMGQFGQLMALKQGRYTCVPLQILQGPTRQQDIAAHYDMASYKPKMSCVEGMPMYLG